MECPCCSQSSSDEQQMAKWTLDKIHYSEFACLPYHSLLPPLVADQESGKMGLVVTSKEETLLKPLLVVCVGIVTKLCIPLESMEWEPLCDEKAGYNQVGMTGYEWLEFVRGYQYGFGASRFPFARQGSARKAIQTTSTDDKTTSRLTMGVDESTLLLDQTSTKIVWDQETETKFVDQLVRCGFYLDQRDGYRVRYLILMDQTNQDECIEQYKQYRFGAKAKSYFLQ